MSRAGRPQPQPQPDEVKPGDIRVLNPDGNVMPPEAERHWRANQVFISCKSRIVGPYMALWPGESIGAAMADRWLQEIQQWAYKLAQAETDTEAAEIGSPTIS
jgi:hypothetical protein